MIQYRPLEKKDKEAVCEIINQSFGLYRYVPNAKMLEVFKKQYLYSCLCEATFRWVAVKGEAVVGVIMGKADACYRGASHILDFARMLWYTARMKYPSKSCAQGMRDYQRLHNVYRQFDTRHKNEFDGVLTLFAVSEESRGFGVGKQLLQTLLDDLRSAATHKIYLYTDSTCNTGFYDKQGLSRIEQQTLTICCEGKDKNIDVFLYEKTL